MSMIKTLIMAINGVLGLAEIILGFRFILRLFGANPSAAFVQWIYQASQPLLYPFRGIFASPSIEPGYVLDFSTLFAMLTYGLAAYLLAELVYAVHSARQG